ncbi:MAG: Na(+)-translocating NADH-quinone reductase subunit C [Chlamydiales bacterium]|nr:Na(+)-translocating NADH-quinone reductase subunit C [Chlamydiales bacterium]MCH9635504.1 Na(+)-translocating NADH-quinone reductase subunit C [Chlamydiales bacterium]
MSTKKTDGQTILFITVLCVVCGLLLAVIAYSLQGPQERARAFDRSKQMLIAAKIVDHEGFFILLDERSGKSVRAAFADGVLKPDPEAQKATDEQIAQLAEKRIRPLITDSKGDVFTLKQKGLDLSQYLEENKKAGYADLPNKLLYAVLPNGSDLSEEGLLKELDKVYGFVIPVSGFGLWAPIYGYIALEADADTVIGTTWYEMGETPGLGANITEAWWQNQFFGKVIFHEPAAGKPDFKSANIGIVVVKGKVSDVYGSSAKSHSAVDGISGATLTGDGVTAAYSDSLTPYRNFFIKVRDGKKNAAK